MTAQEQPDELLRLITGYQVSQAISVAASLGIADLLKAGPVGADALATATGSHPRALYRLLRALAAVGIFHEGTQQDFSLTAMGERLRSDAAAPVGPLAIFNGRPYMWEAWANLSHSIKTGENAFRNAHGVGNFEYRSQRPEEEAIFDQAMTGNSKGAAEVIMAACDFSRYRLIVDVGGGQGAMLAAVLAAHAGGRGILFDQPHVVARAEPVLRAAGVADRCETASGSFFDGVPGGGDAYILKAILHDWNDDASISILRRCRQAISANGKLIVIERIIAPPNEIPEGKFSDLNMLVEPGGEERTSEEFDALFAAAGFRLTNVIPTGTRWNVIEGVPA
jgi:hypothetical protein